MTFKEGRLPGWHPHSSVLPGSPAPGPADCIIHDSQGWDFASPDPVGHRRTPYTPESRSISASSILAPTHFLHEQAAVDTNRLGNDTYKRLNLGLVVYGVASAVILWTSPAPATSVTQA